MDSVLHTNTNVNNTGPDPEEIKRRVSCREFIASDTGKPIRKGAAICSPLRPDDRRPSLGVYDNGWKDFATGESGDIFDYVMRRNNCDFRRALEIVAAYAGNPHVAQRGERVSHEQPAHSEPPSAIWQHGAIKALEISQQRLWSGRPDARRALDWLRARGWSDEQIRAKGLGYNPKYTKTDCRKDDGQRAYLPPGIVIPIYQDGTLWALRVRTLGGLGKDGEPLPKYLNLAGSKLSGALLNAERIAPGGDVLIVEGEFDYGLTEQILSPAFPDLAVVTLGPASNRATGQNLERLRSAGRVFAALDNDQAGRDATKALAATLGDKLIPLDLPAGKDVTEFVIQHGGDLAEWFAAAQRFSWFPNGVWNSVRSALLCFFPKTVAAVIEMLNDGARAGLLNLENFSIPEAKAANARLDRGCSPASIERVITGNPDLFSSILEIDSNALHISNPDENPGRPSKRYKAVSLPELLRVIAAFAFPRIFEQHHPAESIGAILAKLNADMLAGETRGEDAESVAAELSEILKPAYQQQGNAEQFATQRARRECARLLRSFEDHTSTLLPDGWKADAYTAAFFHVHPRRDEGMSRADIKRTFGVSNGSIKTLTERAGLKPVERFELHIISTATDLERQVTDGRRAHDFKAYPKRLVCSTRQGKKITREYEPNDPDAMQSFVSERLASGDSVAVEYQLANTFEVVRETPPERKERQSAAPIEAAETPPERKEPKTQLEPPAPERFYGKTYNPAWVKAQLVYALRLLGKLHGFEYISPDGELIPIPDTIAGLIEAVLGRNLSTGDSLIDFARSEFGAVVTNWHEQAGEAV